MTALTAAKLKSGVLHSVRAAQYPELTSPAARIMAESSPMYAWIDDTVPQKLRKDAAWRLARFRMPTVLENLRVVLRSQEPLQEEAVHAELGAHLNCTPPHIDYANIFNQPLEVGPFEVVAIYTLLPPAPPAKEEPQKSVLQAWADEVLTVLYRRPRQLLQMILRRLTFFTQLSHYGLSTIRKMNTWIYSLIEAEKVGQRTDIYDSNMYNLQTMCVAANKQRQGLGAAVMQLAKREVLQMQGSGMLGLCQSDATRVFYEKQGFRSRDVFTHPTSDLLHAGIRKHFLVAWDARRATEDATEGFSCDEEWSKGGPFKIGSPGDLLHLCVTPSAFGCVGDALRWQVAARHG